jgi:hypothetical protein
LLQGSDELLALASCEAQVAIKAESGDRYPGAQNSLAGSRGSGEAGSDVLLFIDVRRSDIIYPVLRRSDGAAVVVDCWTEFNGADGSIRPKFVGLLVRRNRVLLPFDIRGWVVAGGRMS